MRKNTTIPAERLRAAYPWLLGGAAVGLGTLVPAGLAWVFTHPPRRLHRHTPRYVGVPYERVRLRSADGVSLSAWYIPASGSVLGTPPRGALVVCHGYYGNRGTMLPHIDFLHKAGYAVLVFDFRAHGWSGGRLTTIGCKETLDLEAAIDWMAARPELNGVPLGVLGESMGASVSLLVAADDLRIRAVVADSAYARLDRAVRGRMRLAFGTVGEWATPSTQRIGERILGVRCEEVAPVEAITRIAPRPVLLIHGMNDRLIDPDNSRRLLEAAPENTTLWEVPGAWHTGSIHVAGDEYACRVLRFLDAALNP